MIVVTLEDARQAGIAELIGHSDDYSAARYPAECRYPVDVGFLARPEVRFMVARHDGIALGCGAAVIGAGRTAELKRIIVKPEARGCGVGRKLMAAIEAAARQDGVSTLLLETGPKSEEALALYRRCGFRKRGPFGQYPESPHSVFMEKLIA